MAVKPVVYDDTTKKHRPLGSGEKMDGLSASSIVSSQSGNIITTGSDGLAYATGSGIADPAADNLLETTPSGKLKMDVDRLSEWLDGHPADAKAFSEAVKVVSGDSGNVITKGSDKGAYLAKGDISSAVSGMTEAQKQQLASALADGTTVTASNGKLHAATQAGDAAQLADGKTIVASGGKLTANLTNATVAQKKAIAQALAGEGLLVNSSTGKLDVDFDSMDDTEFRKMMQGFIDKQTLKSTGGANHFYVDGSDSDGDREPSEEDPRPNIGAPSDPFKTIQRCVDYITQIYKFASTNAYIECKNINVTNASGTLVLPSFDRTTATITIRGADFTGSTARGNPTPVSGKTIKIVYNPSGTSARYGINVIGTGVWALRNFDVTVSDALLDRDGGHLAALHVQDYATCTIHDCKLKNVRGTNDKADYTTGEHVAFLSNYGDLEVGANNEIDCRDVTQASPARVIKGITVADSSRLHIGDTRSNYAYTMLQFTLSSSQGSDTVIPKGTRASNGTLVFATNFSLTIPAGSTKGSVSASCTTAGTAGNGVAAGAITTLVDSVSGVASVTNTTKSNYAADDDRRLKMSGSFESLMYVNSSVSRNAAFQGQVDVSGVDNANYKFYIYAGGNVRVSDYGLLNADHNNMNSTDTYLGATAAGVNDDGTNRMSYVQTSTYSWYD